ncbi:MAG: hypothetical protein AAFY46_05545 [Planctomycetota bacterium]
MFITTRSFALTVAAGMPCFVATAQHETVLDRVPADAAMIVSIANVSAVLDGAQAFAQAAKLPEMNMGVSMAKGMTGMPGVNATGPAALIFSSLDGLDRGPEDLVVLVPVSNYSDFATGLGGTGNGLESVDFQGENVSMKDVGGGFAAIGPFEATVGAFEAAEGVLAQHQAAMGDAGNALAGDQSVVVSVAVEAFSEQMLEAWAEGSRQMEQMAQFGGAQADQIEGQIAMIDQIVNNFARDGERGLVGISLDGRGVSVDLAANFKQGSELGAFFAESSSTADTFAKLPGGEYIGAWAMNIAGGGIRELMNNMNDAGQGMNAGGMPGMDFGALLDNATSMAQVIGANPAGLMGGIFPYTTMVIETNDADALIQSYGESVAAMNDQEANGMLLTSSFDANATDVGGVEAYGWSVSMMPDMNNENAMQMQMMLPMLFGGGANGPSGYVAAADEGTVVMTYTRTGDVLGNAVEAARNGGSLVTNDLLAAQAERLPAESFMVGYLDIGTVARAALPMVGMFAPEAAAIDVPAALSPVAFAATAEGGSMSFRTVVPMDLISTTIEIAQSFEEGQGGGGGNGGGDPEF